MVEVNENQAPDVEMNANVSADPAPDAPEDKEELTQIYFKILNLIQNNFKFENWFKINQNLFYFTLKTSFYF